jgi:hypothetical protein
MRAENLAARAGRWSAAHWKTATLVWLAFVVAAVAIGRGVGTHKLTDAEQGTGETARAQAILAAMKLLGDWNWYRPRWLEWLPRLNVEAALHEERPPHAAPVLD